MINKTPLPITDLLKKLNLKTKNIKLYAEALTHNSYNNEKKVGYTYQRLEFLGDAVISKLISVFLYYQNQNEHEMTENRKKLVNTDIFRKASDELNLISYCFFGKGIDHNKDTKKVKTDIFEALSGAIFLDQGEIVLWEFLKKTIIKYYKNDNEIFNSVDYKSKIQEFLQSNIASNKKNKKNKIYYDNYKKEDKEFYVKFIFNDIVYGIGKGTTIKEAEKNAAKQAYEKFIFPK